MTEFSQLAQQQRPEHHTVGTYTAFIITDAQLTQNSAADSRYTYRLAKTIYLKRCCRIREMKRAAIYAAFVPVVECDAPPPYLQQPLHKQRTVDPITSATELPTAYGTQWDTDEGGMITARANIAETSDTKNSATSARQEPMRCKSETIDHDNSLGCPLIVKGVSMVLVT